MTGFASFDMVKTAGWRRRETRCWRTLPGHSLPSSTTTTRARRTGSSSSTGGVIEYEQRHSGVPVFCYANRLVVPPGNREPTFERHGIGRVPPEPSGFIAADYVLGVLGEDGKHSWGMLGSCTLMARTETFRVLGGFDGSFRRRAELDLAVRAAFAGAHFISVDAPLVTQHLTPTADKASNALLRYRLLLVEKHRDYLKQKDATQARGATCMRSFTARGTARGASGTSPHSSSFLGGCHCGGSGDRPCSLVYDRYPDGPRRPDRRQQTRAGTPF